MDKVNNKELLKFILESIEMVKDRFEKLDELQNKVTALMSKLS